jgi:hypothetical protein
VIDPSKLDDTIVLWLFSRTERRGTVARLRDAIRPLTTSLVAKHELDSLIESAIDRASRDRLIARTGSSLRLTDDGAKRAAALVGKRSRPLSWRFVVERVLPGRALGTQIDGADLDAERLRAVALARGLGLGDEKLTLTQARDRIAWKQLGVDSTEPFTIRAVMSELLRRALDSDRALPPERAVALLSARAVGAPRTDAGALRRALVARYLATTTTTTTTTAPAKAPVPAAAQGGETDRASEILAAARRMTTGRFGDDKVFISHLHRVAARTPTTTLDEFKNELVRLHTRGLITLARADLVEAMNPADVAESETRYLSATFHFVRLPWQ